MIKQDLHRLSQIDKMEGHEDSDTMKCPIMQQTDKVLSQN